MSRNSADWVGSIPGIGPWAANRESWCGISQDKARLLLLLRCHVIVDGGSRLNLEDDGPWSVVHGTTAPHALP